MHRELARCVFEMNDWLLPMQQWEGVAPDLHVRFHDPERPHFGPPHAASTGAYETALARGLRSQHQLQFRDGNDAFYVAEPHRVLGALRSEAYDNTVRIDSAAHAPVAAVKMLRAMIGRH